MHDASLLLIINMYGIVFQSGQSNYGRQREYFTSSKELQLSQLTIACFFLADQKTTKKIGNGHLTKLKFCRWSKILTLSPIVRLAWLENNPIHVNN